MTVTTLPDNDIDIPELAIKVGDVFLGPSKTLTDTHFTLFSAITNDMHPIHYDLEYARATQFGRPLAHGLLLNSLTALGATAAVGLIHGFVIVEQGSRFLAPAMVGDTLQPKLTIERIWRDGARIFCRIRTELTNQREETVLEGFHLYRVFDTPAVP